MAHNSPKAGFIAGITLLLAACGSETDDIETSGNIADRSGDALSEIVGDVGAISIAAGAFERTGLKGILEGDASYTVLAPTDTAFDGLGEDAKAALASEDRGAIVAAVLRDHMVPGALTPDAIRSAIQENDGEVSLATFGAGNLTLTLDGEQIIIRNESGQSARLTGESIAGNNGVMIPIDAVLVDTSALLGASE
ncbi:fasciclin domain-containing protein [Erythrobacter ani]|uniref:Fasciclin domain-containing protein n=1 Tax=Erythrobacter ani TaxID=2827235 RepID=A0ABS6SIQ4_9SPHN|nr:fasciclin domain-containing protein [Erythrobacter ani]MBV7264888.1 fasciclin domain-containing protein [Erythrobacter ani]